MKNVVADLCLRVTPPRAVAALCLIILLFVAAGHADRRIAQLMMLAFPVVASLLLALRSPFWRGLRNLVVWGVCMSFVVDGALRYYLLAMYQAPPESSTVLGAMANASVDEGKEYLRTFWRMLSIAAAVLMAAGALLALAIHYATGDRSSADGVVAWSRHGRLSKGVLLLVLLLSALAYVSKPWRRLHPIAYWVNWSHSVSVLRESWRDQELARSIALDDAVRIEPTLSFEGRSTVVVMIADSINRDNLGIYGYPRDTTPNLQLQQALLGRQLVRMRNAWSSEASTIPSLNSIFHAPVTPDARGPHMMALARAAGYKVWWISNQADIAIENQHARLADHVLMLNSMPGRNSRLLDEGTLEPLKLALRDEAPRKLIILHLMGAHPHYRFRYPAAANPYDDLADAVDHGMRVQGQPRWIREFRQEYDAALLYHDKVVSEALDLTRASGQSHDYRAWMYLSDHGQEVGHSGARVGHSPSTAAGYRIPALIWQSRPRSVHPVGLEARPFRADWTDMTLAHLLGLHWSGYQSTQDVLNKDYVWRSPLLPISINSFSQ